MNFSEMMFYAEAEGMLPTRQGKINKVKNFLSQNPNLSVYEIIEVLTSNGIYPDKMTDKEQKELFGYIMFYSN